MECLKRKKMYEQQRDQVAGQQFNIEQTSFAIDSIKDTATTVCTPYIQPNRLRFFCSLGTHNRLQLCFSSPRPAPGLFWSAASIAAVSIAAAEAASRCEGPGNWLHAMTCGGTDQSSITLLNRATGWRSAGGLQRSCCAVTASCTRRSSVCSVFTILRKQRCHRSLITAAKPAPRR